MSGTNGLDYQRSGDFTLVECSLTSHTHGDTVDISEMVDGLGISEGMDQAAASCEISIIDTNDLLYNFPIVGGETFTFIYHTDNDSPTVEWLFTVISVSGSEEVNDFTRRYTLSCVAPELLVSSYTRISKAYKDKTNHEIVADLFGFVSGNELADVDETIGSHHIIIPQAWNIFRAIRWLAKLAQGSDHPDTPAFKFFQNQSGFVYKNVANLIEQEPDDRTYYANTPLNIEGGEDKTARTFIEFNIINNNDLPEQIGAGVYASTLDTYDPITHKRTRLSSDYINDFNLHPRTQEFPVNSDFAPVFEGDVSLQHYRHILSTSNRANDSEYSKRAPVENGTKGEATALRRDSINQQYSHLQIAATVYGDSTLTSGMVLDIIFPSNSASTEYVSLDGNELRSGKYLVREVNNDFTKNLTHNRTQVILSTCSYSRDVGINTL